MAARKSKDAFRTISEVSEWLDTPAHVLRFWESRFPQVKPVKRAGGRRYYRPADMLLLGGIKKLLHQDGMTIRGAQKLLREEGIKHVSAMSMPLDGKTEAPAAPQPEAAPTPAADTAPAPEAPAEATEGQSSFFLEGGEQRAPEKAAPAAKSKPTELEDEDDDQLDLIAEEESQGPGLTPAQFRARLKDPEAQAALRANVPAVQQTIVKLLALQARMAGR